MGTLTPVLGTLTKTITAVQAISGAVDTLTGNTRQSRVTQARQDQAVADLQARQAQQTAEAQQQAQQDRAKIELDAKAAEDRRRAALKRAVAKRNARFGATGIGGSGGSREAVLLGLFEESEAERKQREELDKLRFNAIDNDLANLSSRNVLAQTQLAERQQLERVIQKDRV